MEDIKLGFIWDNCVTTAVLFSVEKVKFFPPETGLVCLSSISWHEIYYNTYMGTNMREFSLNGGRRTLKD